MPSKTPKGIKVNATVSQGGSLSFPPNVDFAKMLKPYEGEKVLVQITKRSTRRSYKQNSYLWGVVYHELQQGLTELGNRFTAEEVHELCKVKFLSRKEFPDPETGEMLTVVQSTADLSKDDFGEYVDNIKEWAKDYFSIDISEPYEVAPIY